MAENKKSFVLYADLLHTVRKMPDDKAGVLLKTILSYVNDENPVVDDLLVDLVFEPIKQQLKRDLNQWESVKEVRSDSGNLGNLKRWHLDLYKQVIKNKITLAEAVIIAKDRTAINSDKKTSQNIANVAVNGNVNDTVTVTVTDNVREVIPPANNLEKSNLFRKPVVPSFQEVLRVFISQGGTEEMAKKYFEVSESTGWFYKGSPITNFSTQVSSYIQNWNKINQNGKTSNSPFGNSKNTIAGKSTCSDETGFGKLRTH